jgi:hypothetical protein
MAVYFTLHRLDGCACVGNKDGRIVRFTRFIHHLGCMLELLWMENIQEVMKIENVKCISPPQAKCSLPAGYT